MSARSLLLTVQLEMHKLRGLGVVPEGLELRHGIASPIQFFSELSVLSTYFLKELSPV